MKKDEFIQLAKDVNNCRVCENMFTLPHLKTSEYLENDAHGFDIGTPYVNRWNLWQGNLDADIMVIGQDYGQKETESNIELWKSGNYTNPTDVALRNLFNEAFSIDIDSEDTPLFFTNMANCYRKQKTTGNTHSGWLPLCANKFMERLIRIINPKVIIVLGQTAFEALHCMEGLPIICINPQETVSYKFSEVIKHQYELRLYNKPVGVFPVYHPGANSKRNRSFDEQLEDWKRIANYYEQVK